MEDDAAGRVRHVPPGLPGRPAYRAGAGLLAAVILVVLFQFAWASPRRARLAVQQQELALARSERAEAASTDRRLAGLTAETERLGQQLDHLAQAFPTAREAPILLRQLPVIAAQSGLTLRSYTPRPPEKIASDDSGPDRTTWGVQLEFTGRFHDVVGFLARVAALPHVIRVRDLSFNAGDPVDPDGTIRVSGVAETQAIEQPAGHVRPPSGREVTLDDTSAPPLAALYDPGGRRDPFLPLLSAAPAPNRRPRGLAGMAAGELALRGIVTAGGGRTAVLEAAGGRSWFVRGGERLLDGVIGSIDAETVEVQPLRGTTIARAPLRLGASPREDAGEAVDGVDPDVASQSPSPRDVERRP